MQAMFQGLSTQEAAARLAAEGPNELPHAGHRSLPRILRDVLSEPMFGLLLGAGLIYLFLGDTVEALLLLVFASLSVAIAVGAGDPKRARAGNAAGSHQPPRPGDTRWRAKTHRRPRGGTR